MSDSIILHGREIFYNVRPDNYLYNVDDQVVENYTRLEPKASKGTPGAIKELKKLVAEYPDIPQYQNLLAIAYENSGNIEKATEILETTYQKFPNYVYGRTNLATMALNYEDYKRVPELLGKELSLFALFPERSSFHYKELLDYNELAAKYLYYIGEYDKAYERWEEMREVSPDEESVSKETGQLLNLIRTFTSFSSSSKEDASEELTYRDHGYNKDIQTREEPVLQLELTKGLYINDLTIDHNLVERILAQQPYETLVDDLHAVLQDAIKRFEYYRDEVEYHPNTHTFPIHALFLLAELKDERSLPVVLDFMHQGEELLRYWLGDLVTHSLWEIIYHLGSHRLEDLKAFVKEPNNFLYARSAVSNTVEQIGQHHPERREEVLAWYRDLFDYFLDNIDDERIIDIELINLMLWECMDLNAAELKDYFETFFKKDFIDHALIGSIDYIRMTLEEDNSGNPFEYHLCDNIYDRYKENMEAFSSDDDYFDDPLEYDDVYDDPDDQVLDDLNTLISKWPSSGKAHKNNDEAVAKKPGRNDPCHCGSGKKYKKCCMNKE